MNDMSSASLVVSRLFQRLVTLLDGIFALMSDTETWFTLDSKYVVVKLNRHGKIGSKDAENIKDNYFEE